MSVPNNLSRRKFFKYLGSILIAILSFSWIDMIGKLKYGRKKENLTVNIDSLNNEINFLDQVIIIKNKNQLSVFSSKCPHLGCRINHVNHEEIICPCHGSRFNLDGENTKGPAVNKLSQLSFKYVSESQIKIDLS